MYRKVVYCEYAFWQEFIKSCPTHVNASERSLEQMQQWIGLYCFLAKSDIVFDMSLEDFQLEAPQDQYLLSLWQKSAEGACGLRCKKKNFPYAAELMHEHITPRQLSAVYLTTQETTVCQQQAQRFGVIIMNMEMVFAATHLFKDNGTAFPSQLARDWNFMRGLLKTQPKINLSNAMIIADNYLLYDQQRIQYNLLPILKILLPEQLDYELPYQICIFTEDKQNQLRYRLSMLVKTIKNIRPKLNFQLMIYLAKDTFHDRAIITNNIWIGCGHGFDIFSKNGAIDKSTTINIVFPFLQSAIQWADQAYLNLIDDAREIDKQADPGQNYWGIKKHGCRLYDF
ncbi:MAG: hypothetical protein IKN91_07790 [Paludibacteraceae bacterium]|nr:hypothetical protein [Paludibacteraceae bacterium]